jgi:hypothetical protein
VDICRVAKHLNNQDKKNKQDKAAAQIFVQVEVAQQVAEALAEAQAEAQAEIKKGEMTLFIWVEKKKRKERVYLVEIQ